MKTSIYSICEAFCGSAFPGATGLIARRSALPQHAPLALRSTLFVFLLSLLGCSTPRVLEVSSQTRLQDVKVADRELFAHDKASRFHYVPQDLSAAEQREEFFVRWTPSTVGLVKFECRQVNKPNAVMEQTYSPHGDRTTVFAVRGEEFHSGGPVSAWRVSLWDGDTLLAERKSTLW